MIVVIIAGGAGTRLWPISTPDYPKHLLRVNGSGTLLQGAFDRAKKLTSVDKIYVETEASHAHHVQDQLDELRKDAFIIEPERRNTSGAVLASLRFVESKHADKDEPVAFLWADHYIRDKEAFAQSFRLAGEASSEHDRVVLVGIEPTYPSTGFGYIEKGELLDRQRLVYEVASFREKPPFEDARTYVKSGHYLWNGGYLVGTLHAFEKAMQEYAQDLWADYQMLCNAKNEDEFEKSFLKLDNVALDYRFNEKVKNLLVVPASFDWMDLGSFNDMYSAVDRNEQGNYLKGHTELDEVTNSYIYNEEDKPIAVIGLDNVVVVNTPHGLLVSRKDLSQKVGDVAKKINGAKK